MHSELLRVKSCTETERFISKLSAVDAEYQMQSPQHYK